MGKIEIAETIFSEVLKTYPKNGEVIAHTNYCLSWIDVQKNNPKAAIARLQNTLAENTFSGEEFCSKAQFFIGRIYLSYINDNKKADEEFQKLLEKYPKSKIIDHPFVQRLKGD